MPAQGNPRSFPDRPWCPGDSQGLMVAAPTARTSQPSLREPVPTRCGSACRCACPRTLFFLLFPKRAGLGRPAMCSLLRLEERCRRAALRAAGRQPPTAPGDAGRSGGERRGPGPSPGPSWAEPGQAGPAAPRRLLLRGPGSSQCPGGSGGPCPVQAALFPPEQMPALFKKPRLFLTFFIPGTSLSVISFALSSLPPQRHQPCPPSPRRGCPEERWLQGRRRRRAVPWEGAAEVHRPFY